MDCQRAPNNKALKKKKLQSHVEKKQDSNTAKKRNSNLMNVRMNMANGYLGFSKLSNSLTGQVSIKFSRKTMCHKFKISQFYVSLD
jgi:hypothetical protein